MAVIFKQGKASTSVAQTHKGQTISEEHADQAVGSHKMFEDPPCNVGVNASYTKNLGDYNGVKIGCSLNVPCEHGEINETFDFAKDWVNTKMQEMMSETDG